MKTFVKVIICVVAFIVTFGICFKIGIDIPTNKYYKPLKVNWTSESGEIVKDLSYGSWEGVGYDLYVPSGLDKEKNQALILFIHGGGFTAGDKSEEDKWCKFYATKGYIVATANYTLQQGESDFNIPLMDEQIVSCVKAIQNECEERGYHVTQMALSGQSAGGCLAMIYAYKHANESIPVKFVFQQSGPTTFEPEQWGVKEGDETSPAKFASSMSGQTITDEMMKDGSYKEILNAFSPAALVSKDTVPTLCGYGPKDKIVPVGQKTVLFEAFEKYGVKYDYLNFEHSGHGLLSDPDMQERFVKLSLEYCDNYFTK